MTAWTESGHRMSPRECIVDYPAPVKQRKPRT